MKSDKKMKTVKELVKIMKTVKEIVKKMKSVGENSEENENCVGKQ